MVKVFPEDSGPYAIWLAATCAHAKIPSPDLQDVIRRFQSSKGDSATFNALKSILDLHASGQRTCFSSETLETLIKTLAESSALAKAYRNKIYHLYAFFYANEKRYAEAIHKADQSLSLSPNNIHLQFQRLLWLQAEDRYTEALESIKKMQVNLNLFSSPLYAEDLKRGEQLIQQKIWEIQQEQNDHSRAN